MFLSYNQSLHQTCSAGAPDAREFVRELGVGVVVNPARLEHPGSYIEELVTRLAEAIAAGLPVVATNVEGIPEVLDGTDSIMVSPDDPVALREAMLKTLNRSKEEKAAAIVKGRRRAEDFRIDNRIYALVKLFEEVLAGRF